MRRARLPTPVGNVAIEASDAELAEMAALYPGLVRRPVADRPAVARARIVSGREGLTLAVDGHPVAAADDWRRLAVAFEHWLEQLILARRGRRLALHAGAVEAGGRCWIVAGRSGAGKTSTAFHLLEMGGRLVCEEIALVDANGRVAALPRSLVLHPVVAAEAPESDGASGGTRTPRDGSILYRPGRLARRARRVDGVLLPSYTPRGEGRIATLDPASAVTELLPHLFEPPEPAEAFFDAVIAWCERWPVVELVYPDGRTARRLLARLTGSGR